MELTEPKAKKFCRLRKNLPLPIILRKDGSVHKFAAVFNGFSVIIDEKEDMKNVISMGYFGKASFSRSYPNFTSNQTEILRDRQYTRRKQWSEKCSDKKRLEKVIVVPDSDSENEDYFTNLKPVYRIDGSGFKEDVWLSLEETFFLARAVSCLNVSYKNSLLEPKEMWKLFTETDPNFVRNYVVYYYYRSKNWVVKPGIKFGGDYLLYKEGPPFYHATYVVVIDVLNQNMKRIKNLTDRSIENVTLLGLNRLCETAGKELIICKIIWPKNTEDITYENFTNIQVKEVLMKRWNLTQERDNEAE